jgi:RING-like zinc finger/PA domain
MDHEIVNVTTMEYSTNENMSDPMSENPRNSIRTFHVGNRQLSRFIFYFKKTIQAVSSFTYRLWLAYFIMIGISTLIRNISHNFGNDKISPTLMYTFSTDDSTYLTEGVPALFGSHLETPIKTQIIHINSSITDFCRPLSNADRIFKNRNIKSSFALVARGGCVFEKKVYYIQEAGFAGAIIYNSLNLSIGDNPVRMSAYFTANNIHIVSMYLTFSSAEILSHFQDKDVIVSPSDWYLIPFGSSFTQMIKDFIYYSLKLWTFSISFLVVCFFTILACNLITTRQLMFVQTMELCINFILDDDVLYSAPRLSTIPFPKRTLTAEDIECMNSPQSSALKKSFNNPCCAVCIEDFARNDSVRDLPCGHIYHCEW